MLVTDMKIALQDERYVKSYATTRTINMVQCNTFEQ